MYAICDQQTPENQAAIEASVAKLFMHGEHDIEKLVLKNTTQEALERFIDALQWPPHLTTAFPVSWGKSAISPVVRPLLWGRQ